MLRSASDSAHSAGKGSVPTEPIRSRGRIGHAVAWRLGRCVRTLLRGLDIVSVDQTPQELLGICKKAEVDEELLHHEA